MISRQQPLTDEPKGHSASGTRAWWIWGLAAAFFFLPQRLLPGQEAADAENVSHPLQPLIGEVQMGFRSRRRGVRRGGIRQQLGRMHASAPCPPVE